MISIRSTSTGEGWGISYDGTSLVVTDGGHKLHFFALPSADSAASSHLVKLKEVEVFDSKPHGMNPRRKVSNLNEIEVVNGFVFANVWYQDVVLRIHPNTGEIVQRFDMRSLYPRVIRTRRADYLNGIAFNSSDDTFLLTGKFWPSYYRLQLDVSERSLRAVESMRSAMKRQEDNADKPHMSNYSDLR